MPSGKLYRWEFKKAETEVSIDVEGSLTLDHLDLMAEAALAGMGVAYLPDHVVKPYIEAENLWPALTDWCPSEPGLCIYYPGHRHVPAPLRAFIDTVKDVDVTIP